MSGVEAGTIPVREGEELDTERVTEYLRSQLSDLPDGELEIRQFPTGASNLTYLLTVGSWTGVLRRAPLGPVPPKAHDMVREARLLERLHPVYPLAPRPYLICSDPSVIGVPFHVMEPREGVPVAQAFPDEVELPAERCREVAENMMRTLVKLHAVDYQQAGLGELGHPEGFLERQTRGWIGRWEKAQTEKVEGVDRLAEWLSANVPESPAPTVIHNDFHIKNLLFDADDPRRITAVLDWEMATIGDPLMDFAVTLSYWLQEGDPIARSGVLSTATMRPGFPGREELMELYERESGRDLTRMDWYLPFAYFKVAVILQQIYARWVRGQTKDPRFEAMGPAVKAILDHARALAGTAGMR